MPQEQKNNSIPENTRKVVLAPKKPTTDSNIGSITSEATNEQTFLDRVPKFTDYNNVMEYLKVLNDFTKSLSKPPKIPSLYETESNKFRAMRSLYY